MMRPPTLPPQERGHEIAADGKPCEDSGEHQREAIHRWAEEERQHAEPDNFKGQRGKAGHYEHHDDDPLSR